MTGALVEPWGKAPAAAGFVVNGAGGGAMGGGGTNGAGAVGGGGAMGGGAIGGWTGSTTRTSTF